MTPSRAAAPAPPPPTPDDLGDIWGTLVMELPPSLQARARAAAAPQRACAPPRTTPTTTQRRHSPLPAARTRVSHAAAEATACLALQPLLAPAHAYAVR